MPTQPRALPAILLATALCLALCAATGASAATRFAAPGGTGVDPCANPAEPCTLFVAAGAEAPGTTVRTGDEVVLASGRYSDSAGDLGPDGIVNLAIGVNVHGVADRPRPLIRIDRRGGHLSVVDRDIVSHLEITTSTANLPIQIFGGTVEDVIVRSSADVNGALACQTLGGVIRDTACLSSGVGASAMGINLNASSGFAVQLRNVTAVATGAGSTGLRYRMTGGNGMARFDVVGKAVIAHGTANDVFAAGLSSPPNNPGTGATVRIELDHSAFATVGTFTDAGGGTASVTLPGTAGNVTELPLLAADGYHQLPGSPTLNLGAIDGSSRPIDIDGQPRNADGSPDIGADERLANPTATAVACTPGALLLGEPTACVVSVTGDPGSAEPPRGEIQLVGGPGSFGDSGCVLAEISAFRSTCRVTYRPSGVGTHQITATFPGNGVHDESESSTTVSVASPPSPSPPEVKPPATMPPRPMGPPTPPQTKLGKHPAANERKALAVFTFSASPAGGWFECRLDRKRFKRCKSPYRTTVQPGRHTFRVRAVSAAGAVDPTPATFSWSVAGP